MAYIDPQLMDILSTGGKFPKLYRYALSFKGIVIKATYHNDYNFVKKLIERDDFDERIIHDIGLMDVPFPLYYITMCYKQTLWQDFIPEIMPFIKEQREKVDQLLSLWKERYYVDVDSPIDYKKYYEYFYCLAEEDTDDDVFFAPRSKYTENGCREIDLDLFVAVKKFQFSKVKELLECGANPDANLVSIDDKGKDYKDPWNCMDDIGSECSYLCTCEVLPNIKDKNGKWYYNIPIRNTDIGDLLGWAAHEDMYRLLEQYVNAKKA